MCCGRIYTSSSVRLMLNVTFPIPIIYEVFKHLTSLPFSLVPLPDIHTHIDVFIYIYHKYLRGWMLGVNICPISNVSEPSSGQHAVDKAPKSFVWDGKLYYGCCLISRPDMNAATPECLPAQGRPTRPGGSRA